VPIYSEYVGQTRADNTVELRARVEGILQKVYFKEGTHVKKGQLLFTIDKRPFEAALQSAKAKNADVLIVDTAGRLHNKAKPTAELEKMKRIAGREVPQAPHETLLVIDAVTGQNGLEQARQFMKVADVTGIVLTKLDGTAKGGIAVAISKELNLPIRYEAYDWPHEKRDEPPLVEEYTYLKLKLNNGFSDRDFDVRNPNYNFPE